MIRMVSLWSSISLWADRGDDQRDAGDVIAGRDDLKKPWNTRDLLNLREKLFVSPGTIYHAAVQSGPAWLPRHPRRGTCRESRSQEQTTASG